MGLLDLFSRKPVTGQAVPTPVAPDPKKVAPAVPGGNTIIMRKQYNDYVINGGTLPFEQWVASQTPQGLLAR